jgi:hypothetical protein
MNRWSCRAYSRKAKLGRSPEVYDGDMLALLKGLEAASGFQQNTPAANRNHTIR